MRPTDTITAIATPPGEGGIAVVRVSGPQALPIAAQVFRPQRGDSPARFPGYSVHYGRFVEAATGETVDDGLLTVFRAPHSYTGEDTIELSCHGGRVIAARVLGLTLHAGARGAEPGEFTQRAFLNGRLDLAQAEAVADLIRAQTDAAGRLARRLLEGGLSREVTALKEELIGILAAIEVTIDFSDEVGDLDYPSIQARLRQVREGIERLLATAEQGRILREGLRVAIVGRPNVGKSSLLNALLRTERAIVTPIAGTTRDLVEETAHLHGVPVVLTDTAGIRATEDIVERIGVERAERAAAQADAVLLVLDATTGLLPEDSAIAQSLCAAETGPVLVVLNKSDAVPATTSRALWEAVPAQLPLVPAATLLVSAQTGEGLETLETTLLQVTGGSSGATPADTALVSHRRHRLALEVALRSLQEAEKTAAQHLPGDFIAIDARGALDSLGLITGETVTEDIIHRIFQDFCVGK